MRKIASKAFTFFAVLAGACTGWGELLNTDNSLNFQSESFLSSDYSSTPDRNYFFVGANFVSTEDSVNGGSDPLRPRVVVDFRGRFSPQAPVLSSLNLRELYFHQQSFSLGRKRINWSQGDADWELGLFEPQYRWNVLRPQSQGLSGAFLHMGEGAGRGWNFDVMGTPIFLPDQGAGYVLKEGRFEKVSPWFQNLPKEVRLEGSDKVRTLDYQVAIPQLERIVFNSGYAVRLSFDENSHPSQVSLSMAYKPMNVLSLGIDGSAEYDTRAPVSIEPTVMYHKLAAFDYRFRTNPETARGLELRAGAIFEESDAPREMRPELTYALYAPMWVGTTSLGYRHRVGAARISYIRRSGGETRMLGPKASELQQMTSDRIPYDEAMSLELTVPAYRRGIRRFDVSTRWTEGLSDDFSRLTVDAALVMDRAWTLWADLVLVRAAKRPGDNMQMFTAFENHDSLRAGVSYVF